MYHYIGDCISSDAKSILALRESAQRITWRTFRKRVPSARTVLEARGAIWSEKTTNVQIERSPWIACFKGTYRGVPCYYVSWSGFELLWTKETQ